MRIRQLLIRQFYLVCAFFALAAGRSVYAQLDQPGEGFPLPALDEITVANIDDAQKLAVVGIPFLVPELTFSNNGFLLATEDVPGYRPESRLTLWEVETGQRVTGFVPCGLIESFLFTPNDISVAAPCAPINHAVEIWDVDSLDSVLPGARLETPQTVGSLAFNLDGTLLAIGEYDGTIRIWDWSTLAEIRVLTGRSASVESLSFSPDGALLASASDFVFSDDDTVRLWDVNTGELLETLSFRGDKVQFSQDGRLLIASRFGWEARLWEMESLEVIADYTGEHRMAYGSDEMQIGYERRIELFQNWPSILAIDGEIISISDGVVISPDYRVIAKTGNDYSPYATLWGIPIDNARSE